MMNKPENLSDLLRPVWSGDTVYRESFLPVNREGDDTDAPLTIPLLYHAETIFSVTDAACEQVFEEGRDYLCSDGSLLLPKGSRIRKIAWSAYNPKDPSDYPFECSLGGKLLFGEGKLMHSLQYTVTYRHSDPWSGFIPQHTPGLLPRTRERLASKTPFRFGFFGDSITTGANSSGNPNIQTPPFTPMFPWLSVMGLEDAFGCEINYVNHSVSGTSSGWGCEHLKKDFENEIPDLLFIGFGMNDATGNVPPETFLTNIHIMAEDALSLNPDCELLFCSTTLPNPIALRFAKDQAKHEPLLADLAREYGSRAALDPMTSVHQSLLARKHFYDMTGNNINHPNDFLARLYAQTILAVICGDLF